MTEQDLPVIGSEHVFKGESVRVTAVRKRGRGYQVQYEGVTGEIGGTARMADWRKGAQ